MSVPALDARILVFAPLGRDGEVIAEMLGARGFAAETCADAATMLDGAERGAGAVIIAEEALTRETVAEVRAFLETQPPWSDLPVIVLLSTLTDRAPRRSAQTLLPGLNVTELRRPVPGATLESVVNASLRARQRQYELREHLREREQYAEELEQRVAARTAELIYANGILAEQMEVREKAQKQIEQLNEITAMVSTSLETEEVKGMLARLLEEEVGVPAGAILAFEPARDRIELRVAWGMTETMGAALEAVPVAGSRFEPCVVKQADVELRHLERVERLEPWLVEATGQGWRHFFCVPLLAHRTVVGVLLLLREESTMSDERRAFFVAIGQQAGVAIANARLYAEVLARGARLQQLAQKIISIQEAERQRVSRELYDEAGQALTALLFNLAILKETILDDPQEAVRNIAQAMALTSETMEQIRALADAMRTPTLDVLGLDTTLDGLTKEFERRTGIAATYTGTTLEKLPDVVAISLYRVAQEGLANIARHAKATQVTVSLRKEAGDVVLVVEDDGVGFEAASALRRPAEGIGLSGLNERMETLGGRLEVSSTPGEGVRLRAAVPVEE
jgi:signal transduction histidine kinase